MQPPPAPPAALGIDGPRGGGSGGRGAVSFPFPTVIDVVHQIVLQLCLY